MEKRAVSVSLFFVNDGQPLLQISHIFYREHHFLQFLRHFMNFEISLLLILDCLTFSRFQLVVQCFQALVFLDPLPHSGSESDHLLLQLSVFMHVDHWHLCLSLARTGDGAQAVAVVELSDTSF